MIRRSHRAPDWWRELQQHLSAAITAPACIDDGQLVVGSDCGLEVLLSEIHGTTAAARLRLATYQRQYWFRLLSIMQEELPLTCHRLGVEHFNRVALDFLHAHPPRDHALQRLARGFPRWVRHHGLSPAVYEAAKLDRLYSELFMAPTRPAQGFALRRPWQRWHEHWSSISDRRRLGTDDPPPVMPATITHDRAYWVLWRDQRGAIRCEGVSALQDRLLARLDRGLPLDDACAAVERSANASERQLLTNDIGTWFSTWTALGWFAEV